MPKVRMNFTFDEDTAERLRQLGFERHQTMSQALTGLIWNAHVTYSQLRGQMSFNLNPGRAGRKKKGTVKDGHEQ